MTTISPTTSATRCRTRRRKRRSRTCGSKSSWASTVKQAFLEAERCLNCDVQTVFDRPKCIECDACVDICPMDCITFTANGERRDLRTRLTAPALHADQDL